MKILHIITRLNVGGTSTYLKNLTEHLANLDCENVILFGFCESNEIDFTKNNTFRAQIIQIKSLKRSINIFLDIRSFFLIRGVIKRVKPDIVNTHTSKAGIIGRLAAKSISREMPVVHTYHGHLVHGYFHRFQLSLYLNIERFMFYFTDRAIAVSENTIKTFLSLKVGNYSKWELIRTGFPVNKHPKSKVSKSQEFKLLWVGRFTEVKDPLLAIEVMKEISSHPSKKFSLTMIGGGELWEISRKESVDLPITFKGWLKADEIDYSNYDLLLLTSKNEAAGLVILEAANQYIPTISLDVGGVSEFIRHNETGCLVSGRAKELSELIYYLADNPKILEKMGYEAKRLVEKNFSIQQMASEYFQLYKSLLI
jgi:glycosyltransferase involved in cell wall biosynthesis